MMMPSKRTTVQVAMFVLTILSRAQARGYGPGLAGLSGVSTGFPGVSGILGATPGAGGRLGGAPGSYYGAGVPGLGVSPTGGQGRLGLGGMLQGASNTGLAYSNSPDAYQTGYQYPDGQGGAQFKTEEGDGIGNVRGTYGYTDAQGLYRIVNYIADQYGFRATVSTNEPGVDGRENPADVNMIVGQTPAGIQEQYTLPSGYGISAAGGIMGSGRRGSIAGFPGTSGYGLTPGMQFGAAGIPGTFGGVPGAMPGQIGAFGSWQNRQAGTSALAGQSFPRGLPGVSGATGSTGLFSGIPISTRAKSVY